MLFNVNKSHIKLIRSIPHKVKFNAFMKIISPLDYKNIEDAINERIDADILKGSDIQTSGWIPGNDWTGTVYEAIYNVYRDRDAAGKMFGIIVWKVFMERPDNWGFGRYKVNDVPIESMTYFGITP